LSLASYDIEQHNHLFATWTAGRAASVKGGRFSVAQGRDILEACGFVSALSSPDQLPQPSAIDSDHRLWRGLAADYAENLGLRMTHGIAAKLINVYLKSRFVSAGHHFHPNVAALHPPVDRLLLEELARRDFAGFATYWRRVSRRAWSKMSSEEYEDLIIKMRTGLHDAPFWRIEEFWKGSQ